MSKFLQVNQPVRLVAQFPIDLLITMFNGTASPYNVGCSSNNPRMALRDLCSLRAAWSAGGTQDARPNEFFILPTGNPASIMALIDDPISLTNLLPSPLIELDVTLEAYKLGIVSGRLRLQSPGVASGSSAIRLNYGNFDSAVIGMQTPKFEILASGDTKAAPGTFRVIDPFMAIANPMVYSVLPNGLKQSWQDAVNPYHCAPWRLHVDFPPGAVNMANAVLTPHPRGDPVVQPDRSAVLHGGSVRRHPAHAGHAGWAMDGNLKHALLMPSPLRQGGEMGSG